MEYLPYTLSASTIVQDFSTTFHDFISCTGSFFPYCSIVYQWKSNSELERENGRET